MDDTAADKYVEEFFQFLVNDITKGSYKAARNTLRMMVKNIERDTRYKCADIAQEAAGKMHNLQH